MKHFKSYAIFLAGLFLISACQEKKDFSLTYEKFILDNGLQVVLHEDRSDPIVSVVIQYHVGSAREKVGKTGFAHLFEHMLFQRSEHLGRNEFFKKIGELGGSFNGATSLDGTVYYETVPRNALEKVLWMESDRMGYFLNTVTQKGLEREIDVVSNEKRQGENRAFGQSGAVALKYFYPEGHPYSWQVIGSIADLRESTVEDVKDFYRKYYAPNNATLVIAGDFDAGQTKEMIQKYFGEIPARESVPVVQPMPVQLKMTQKLVLEDKFANAAALDIDFPGVEQYHPDAYPLRLLALLLAHGKNSPFYQVLVEERKLTSSVNVASSSFELAGQVSITARAYRAGNLNDIYAGIEEAFRRFEEQGVQEEALERLKIMQETMMYNVMMALESKAQAIARSNVFGGSPDKMVEDLERYKAVTAQDIWRVYQQYIQGKPYVALSTVPRGRADLALNGSRLVAAPEDDFVGQKLVADEGTIMDDEAYEFTPSEIDRSAEPPLLPNTPELSMPEVWKAELGNGMKITGMDYSELPVVNFSLYLNAGMLCEPQGKSGIARLTAAVLNNGTESKTPEELEAALGLLGARAYFGASTEHMQLSGSCLKKNFPQVVKLLQEMLLEPRWDETALELAKKRTIEGIRQSETEPKTIARHVFTRMLYGTDNVLSHAVLVSEEEVKSITMNDVKAFYDAHLFPAQAVFNFVGGYSKQEVVELLKDWEKWDKQGQEQERLNINYETLPAKICFVDYPGARQSYILLGCPAMPRVSSDYYPAVVVNNRLGASSNALLFDVLRLQRGYTYGAYSFFRCGKYANEFRATSSVQAAYTADAMKLFRDCILNYGEHFTAQTLQKTQEAMRNENATAFEEPGDRLDVLFNSAVYGLPVGYLKEEEQILQSMTLAQAQEYISRWLDYDRMFFIVVGDAATQLPLVKKAQLGEVVLVDREGNLK